MSQLSYFTAPGIPIRPLTHGSKASVIMKVVTDAYKTTYEDIAVKSRKREVLEPRQVVCWMMHRHAKITLREIGEYFNTDHTTVIHCVQVVNNLMATEPEFKKKVMDIQRKYYYI